MTQSMTGYGQASLQKESWSLNWEIKSVNSRYLDIKWKIPPALFYLQPGWEKLLRRHAVRGRVELYLDMRILDPGMLALELDRAVAGAMLEELNNFARSTGQEFKPDLNILLRMQSMWQERSSSINQVLLQDMQDCLEQALLDWNTSREQEGAQLFHDLRSRLRNMESILENLQGLAAENAGRRFQDLRSRVDRLLAEMDMEVDENRLFQELGFIADRLDVSEEITRLQAHLNSMHQLLEKPGEKGRKLDFFLQEAFREINTCANKCQNTEMSTIAVDFKTELEKCREQAQNLE
ncbi:YicC/YloC family endoribonuclease [Desulfonatronospira sp.]|uniref:YicC/YloC family endoribonuclease n=1 Tax=Desulfonatronospira sp. TaxID=1962951 RepID=UPI0025C50505|nr:YicC/YloC family endoribonuclease [Desulfonatronospira sp.]